MHLKQLQSGSLLKGAIGHSGSVIEYENQLTTKDSRYIVCKEAVLTIPVVIYAKKNFCLLHALNEKLEMLIPAGLIEFWYFQAIDKRLLSKNISHERRVLTIKQLSGALYILLLGYVISAIIFFYEMLQFKF